MDKQIEIISASDPNDLKQQLQQMVNLGWDIKGVVGYNPAKTDSEPFVIMERDSLHDPAVKESLYENEEPPIEAYFSKPEPPHKEVTISMGGD